MNSLSGKENFLTSPPEKQIIRGDSFKEASLMPGPNGTPPHASCENQRQQCLHAILALVQRDELSSREVLQAIASALANSLSACGTHAVRLTWDNTVVSSSPHFLCDHLASYAILTGSTPLGTLQICRSPEQQPESQEACDDPEAVQFFQAIARCIGGFLAQRLNRRQLREQEERLRLAMEAAGQGFYDLDLRTGAAIVSPEYATMLGYDPATFIETNAQWLTRLHPDDLDRVRQYFQHYVANPSSPYVVEFRQRTAGGDWKWILSRGRILAWDNQGWPVRMLGTHTDIDQRKCWEKSREQEVALTRLLLDLHLLAQDKDEQELFTYFIEQICSLTESTIGFIHEVIENGQIIALTAWNREALRHCTASSDRHYSIGHAGNWVDSVHAGKPVIYNTYAESPNRKGLPPGHTPLYRFLSVPVIEQSTVRFIAGVGNKATPYDQADVDAVQVVLNGLYRLICQRRAERTLREREADLHDLNLRLQRSNEELEQFAAIASHDLQEPLRMVANYTQLLADRYGGQLDAQAHKYIAYAADGAVRMQQLISDLLAYSRLQAVETMPQLFESRNALIRALEHLEAAVSATNAVITHDILPVVLADEVRLTQVFQNIIGNALKFCDHPRPEVHIGVHELDEHWQFSLTDNGIGIAPHYLETVFAVFRRLHAVGEYPGTGIGLAACKRIIEQQGGRIWCASEPGKGTTFCFTLRKGREGER